MQETQVQSLGLEDSLEKEVATLFSILAWKTPCTKESDGLQSMESRRFGQDCEHTCTHTHTVGNKGGAGAARDGALGKPTQKYFSV